MSKCPTRPLAQEDTAQLSISSVYTPNADLVAALLRAQVKHRNSSAARQRTSTSRMRATALELTVFPDVLRVERRETP